MVKANIVVVDEAAFEAWLAEQGVTFEKTEDCYKLSRRVSVSAAQGHGVRVMRLNRIRSEGDEVDSNKLSDLEIKMAKIPAFFANVAKTPATAICKNIQDFVLITQSRLTMGSLKYGSTWKTVDVLEELKQELYDVAGYTYLEWLKRCRNNTLTDADEVRLIAIASSAIVVWQFVKDMQRPKE